MTVTVGLVANVYQEAQALPGWLETHLPYFDDVRILHAGPGGEWSNDGTIELLEKWRVPVQFCAIDEGFGAVRTRALRMSPCDWVMLLDADERFYSVHRVLTCTGESTPHSEVDAILQTYDFRNLDAMACNWENVGRLGADLRVLETGVYDQGVRLREILASGDYDAVATVRRHWHDFSFRRPTQNWHTDPDWQLRLVRNDKIGVLGIHFDSNTRMHERLLGVRNVYRADMTRGPFFDHLHFPFKRMEQEQRAHDVDTYDRIHRGEKPRTWEQFKRGK